MPQTNNPTTETPTMYLRFVERDAFSGSPRKLRILQQMWTIEHWPDGGKQFVWRDIPIEADRQIPVEALAEARV